MGIVTVRVVAPQENSATVGTEGAAIEASDGSTITIAPGALQAETTVSITPFIKDSPPIQLPDELNYIGSLDINVGDSPLEIPAQLEIANSNNLPVGTEVFLAYEQEFPDETGTLKTYLAIAESAIVQADGKIRTQSPPWDGIDTSRTYRLLSGSNSGSVRVNRGRIIIENNYPAALFGVIEPTGSIVSMISPPEADYGKLDSFIEGVSELDELPEGSIGTFGNLSNKLASPTHVHFLTVSFDISSVDVVSVPKIGLPTVTPVGVEIDTDNVPSIQALINIPSSEEADPFSSPIIEQTEFKFENNQPIIYVTGSNFEAIDTSFELGANFVVGNKIYEAEIAPELSETLENNRYKLAIKPPNTVPFGLSEIIINRTQEELVDIEKYEDVTYYSDAISLFGQTEYVFGALRFSDQVAVISADSETVANVEKSSDLLVARIPVGSGGTNDDFPRNLAITNDGSRVYVVLEKSNKIALVDPIVLQQIDINGETPEIDAIQLPIGVSPRAIAIDNEDRYGYIVGSTSDDIYVIDIDPLSETYHQVIKKIFVGSTQDGLRDIAINSDGTLLFVTAPNSSSSAKRNNNSFDLLTNSNASNLIKTVGTSDKSQIIAININSEDVDSDSNRWNKVVGVFEADEKLESIEATSEPLVMSFTNRGNDNKGTGILKITQNNPAQDLEADIEYINLTLGELGDYFDVNESVATTITNDGSYGFVAAFNGSNFGRGFESIDGVQAGSNIGIIKDPLGDNPQLIAATRPIPLGFTSDLVLSNDEKYLYASYPTGGGVYVFDVEEIFETIDNPSNYIIDEFGRSETGYPEFFDSNTAKPASTEELKLFPIDDINPEISVAANNKILEGDWLRNQFTYGVMEGDTKTPIESFGSVRGLEKTPLIIGVQLLETETTDTDTDTENPSPEPTRPPIPQVKWDYLPEPTKPKITTAISEMELYISTFPRNAGLVPEDRILLDENNNKLVASRINSISQDLNPNRVLTATWSQISEEIGQWVLKSPDGTKITEFRGTNTKFEDIDDPTNQFWSKLNLTAGQNYYWTIKINKIDPSKINLFNNPKIGFQGKRFERLYIPWDSKGKPQETDSFSNVTFLTHDGNPFHYDPFSGIFDGPLANPKDDRDNIIKTIAKSIAQGNAIVFNPKTEIQSTVDAKGNVLEYQPETETWKIIYSSDFNPFNNQIENLDRGKPLVLIADWWRDTTYNNAGFSEAAADKFFASLVALDKKLGGKAGTDISSNVYNNDGSLKRERGHLFNSPFHFIGFGRGAVVNSEIIQRMGEFHPNVWGNGDTKLDLQMTTIDPPNPNQIVTVTNKKSETYDYYEPSIKVWDNVSFADNYYQTVTQNLPHGYPILGEPNDLGLLTGGADLNVDLTGRVGFVKEGNLEKNPHERALVWYGGTVDLSWGVKRVSKTGIIDTTPTPRETQDFFLKEKIRYEIDRRLIDFSYKELVDSNQPIENLIPWYTPNHVRRSDNGGYLEPGDSQAQWEGVGTGWYYSLLGGGYHNDLLGGGYEDRLSLPDIYSSPRVSIDVDNTYTDLTNTNITTRMRGDFAIPTLFNGNFDSFVQNNNPSRELPIPSWTTEKEDELVLKKFLKFNTQRPEFGFSLELRPTTLTEVIHNPFVVPDWGTLRFDLHVPKAQEFDPNTPITDKLKVYIRGSENKTWEPLSTITERLKTGTRKQTAIDLVTWNNENLISWTKVQKEVINKISYGKTGFETFHFDIPKELRGKTAQLKFELEGNTPVLLDNVFFQSQHLILGNPTDARYTPDEPESNRLNYLLEKPQYSLSYNEKNKNANWIGWQLNKSWIDYQGPKRTQDPFNRDLTLPKTWFKVTPKNINDYERGHLLSFTDRKRSLKDHNMTFSNILPQHSDINKTNSPWNQFDDYLRDIRVKNNNEEIYIFAGGYGEKLGEDIDLT